MKIFIGRSRLLCWTDQKATRSVVDAQHICQISFELFTLLNNARNGEAGRKIYWNCYIQIFRIYVRLSLYKCVQRCVPCAFLVIGLIWFVFYSCPRYVNKLLLPIEMNMCKNIMWLFLCRFRVLRFAPIFVCCVPNNCHVHTSSPIARVRWFHLA